MYAAPSLILHYILAHGYKPPQEFIDAVINSPDASSEEYYQKILAYSNGYDFWLASDCTKKKHSSLFKKYWAQLRNKIKGAES